LTFGFVLAQSQVVTQPAPSPSLAKSQKSALRAATSFPSTL
jgi:hypothetical protein